MRTLVALDRNGPAHQAARTTRLDAATREPQLAGSEFLRSVFADADLRKSLQLITTLFAGLLNIAGAVALGPLAHVLVRNTAHGRLLWFLVALVVLRPAAAVMHTKGICTLVDLTAASRGKRASTRLMNSMIIATRDVPMAAVLMLVMPMFWGAAGSLMTGLIAAGLIAAAFSHRLVRATTTGQRRIRRAYRELVSELPITVLVLALFAARQFGLLPPIANFAGLAICVLVVRGPLRRVARLLEAHRWTN